MTTLREAAQQALEALTAHADLHSTMYMKLDAINALRAALEQPEQEPKCVVVIDVFDKNWRLEYVSLPVGRHKLYAQQYTYTAPPKRKPLTNEQLRQIVSETVEGVTVAESVMFRMVARAIERAHGIGGSDE